MSQGAILFALIAGWLGLGLALEAVLAARQWRYLAASGAAESVAAATRYGQWRAVFAWLARAEALVRLVVWVPTGALVALASAATAAAPAGGVVFFILFIAGDELLRQPLVWARWRLLQRRFGLSHMTAAERLLDSARALAIALGQAVLAALWLLWPFAILAKPPAWAATAALAVAGAGAGYWLRPNVIAPLFNRFEPLAPGQLRTRLEALMRRCHVRLDAVRVMDGSRRSKLANAYVTGVGRGKRIVLFDTLIERLDASELEAVMAHELGHYRCGHHRRYYGLLAVLMLLGVAACGLIHDALGAPAGPAATLAAIYLLLPALAWPLTPWLAALRRRYEYEADAFAARHASRAGLVSALQKLLAHNRTPARMDPWYTLFYATHPPGHCRLARLKAKPSGAV